MQNEYIHMVTNLLMVLALMLLLVYLIKKFKITKYSQNKYIKIINAVSIGSKEKVILMEVNNTILLIGATPNHIETLYVFDSLETKDEVIKDKSGQFSEQVKSLTANSSSG